MMQFLKKTLIYSSMSAALLTTAPTAWADEEAQGWFPGFVQSINGLELGACQIQGTVYEVSQLVGIKITTATQNVDISIDLADADRFSTGKDGFGGLVGDPKIEYADKSTRFTIVFDIENPNSDAQKLVIKKVKYHVSELTGEGLDLVCE